MKIRLHKSFIPTWWDRIRLWCYRGNIKAFIHAQTREINRLNYKINRIDLDITELMLYKDILNTRIKHCKESIRLVSRS